MKGAQLIQDNRQAEQSIETKRGEIKFRRKLSQQELGRGISIPGTFSSDEVLAFLLDSMDETRWVFDDLVDRSVHISPFVEIGAERGQRSYLLSNEFAAHGFALDLSMDALQYGDRLARDLSLPNAPLRICGDASNLPFRNNSFPFVFCFATLHHFPNPAPVIQEAIRILQDGGHFYFGREPTRGLLAVSLWTRYGHRLSKAEQLLDRIGVLGFVSTGGGLEREYGILENTFPLETWIEATQQFDEVEMTVNRTLRITFNPIRSSLRRWLGRILGGVTSALCRVRKDEPSLEITDWVQRLRCPTCSNEQRESKLELLPGTQGLKCTHCGTEYPQHNGVLLLLSKALQEELYSDWEPLA